MDESLKKLLLEKVPEFNNRYAEKLRVVHFGNAKSGHGLGTIVAYNGTPKNRYLEENFKDAVNLAGEAGLLNGVVNSMYDGARYPYVVQWDNGYKDVYEHTSLTPYDPNNPDHDPGRQVKIRVQRSGLDESMATAALVRASIDDVRCYFRRLGTCGDNDVVKVEPYTHNLDERTGWKQTYIVTVNGNAVGFTDGPVE